MEGTLCTNLGGGPPCNDPGFTRPVIEYDHGRGCSVTGGYLYRGRAVPELMQTTPPAAGQLFTGVYIYGDYCSGTIWHLSATATGGVSNSVLLASGLSIAAFGEDEDGELYVADAGAAKIYRFVSPPAAPTIIRVSVGIASITVNFSAPAGGAAITGYTAACTSSNGGVARSQTGGAGATSIRVSGLTVGKRYSCTVSASNAAGAGQSSAPTSAVTLFDITPILNLLLHD
jgi:hypothetical protein